MERMDFTTYPIENLKKISKKMRQAFVFKNVFTFKDVAEYTVALLISRAVILSGLSPFGFAFYISSFCCGMKKLIIFLCVVVGYMISGSSESFFKYFFAMLLFTSLYFINKKIVEKNKLILGLIAFSCLFISGFIKVLIDGFLLYDTLMLLFESLLSFVLIYAFKNGLEFINSRPINRSMLSNEEVISIAIIISLVLVGFGEMNILNFISLRNVLSILVLLILAFESGSSSAASAGVAIGLINSLASSNMAIIIGCYAFCSLVAGVFRYLGKIGVGLGFILANAIFVVYINGSTEVLINIYEIFISVIAFMLLPKKSTKILGKMLNNDSLSFVSGRTYYVKIKEMIENRLEEITESLKGLGGVFSTYKEGKIKYNPYDISIVFDNVAERVCKDCSLCMKCWEKDFNSTYQIMNSLVDKLDKKGQIDRTDYPLFFSRRCIKLTELTVTINNLYELYKVNLIWFKKVEESRELLSEQFYSVAKIIDRLNKEITSDLKFDESIERDIILRLDKANLEVKNVSVLQNIYGKYEVNLRMKACNNIIKCDEEISRIVSEVIERRMTREGTKCVIDEKSGDCFLKLMEKEAYQISIGVAQAKKRGQQKSGDNYSYMKMDDGKYVLVLSDGMGSGIKASEESSAAISLIQKLLSSGFDNNTAVKLINSVLVLKSPEELFTTIDLAIIDLHTGNVEFSKIGAATTFIKKKGKVEKIKSHSLPAGILKKVDIENSKNRLTEGDYIIMLSDGVIDSNKREINVEGWLEKLIGESDINNPQTFAEKIINMAAKNYNNADDDDMTVMIAKIWKKAG